MQYAKELRARLTRERLASVLAATYGRVRQQDVNFASLHLESAFRSPALLGRHQDGVVQVLRERLPDSDDADLVRRLDKKDRPGRRHPPPRGTVDDGAWVAWSLAIDRAAAVASGEADALLDTDTGRRLLEEGLVRVCRHAAERLLK